MLFCMPRVKPGYVKRTIPVEVSFRPDEFQVIERLAKLKAAQVASTMRTIVLEHAQEVLRLIDGRYEATAPDPRQMKLMLPAPAEATTEARPPRSVKLRRRKAMKKKMRVS